MIKIIDYGVNNICSIKNCLNKINIQSQVITTPKEVIFGDKLILPGVGSFGVAMKKLKQKNWTEFIKKFVENKKNYFLGICLGMQLLASKSYEDGEHEGLKLIDTDVKRLSDLDCKNNIPHVGWNSVEIEKNSKIFKKIPTGIDFYFVHSYAMLMNKSVIANFDYGKKYVAAVQKENIFGVQFHPEKSSKGGQLILQNFNEL